MTRMSAAYVRWTLPRNLGRVAAMLANAERLRDAVLARRAELDLSQLDVWQSGGPSNTTLTDIENGRGSKLSRTTARKLDIGLKWEPGTARRIWDGQEETNALRRLVLNDPTISDAAREEILRILAAEDPKPPAGERGAS